VAAVSRSDLTETFAAVRGPGLIGLAVATVAGIGATAALWVGDAPLAVGPSVAGLLGLLAGTLLQRRRLLTLGAAVSWAAVLVGGLRGVAALWLLSAAGCVAVAYAAADRAVTVRAALAPDTATWEAESVGLAVTALVVLVAGGGVWLLRGRLGEGPPLAVLTLLLGAVLVAAGVGDRR
jgi:hypothetical protein